MTPSLNKIKRLFPNASKAFLDANASKCQKEIPSLVQEYSGSKLENKFYIIWTRLCDIKLTPEFKFHPDRKWRFDFAIPLKAVAIEIEGGIWSGGRHTRGHGYESDCEKYNSATILGWRLFRLSPRLICESMVQLIINYVKTV
jgi:hypothetical protein